MMDKELYRDDVGLMLHSLLDVCEDLSPEHGLTVQYLRSAIDEAISHIQPGKEIGGILSGTDLDNGGTNNG